MGKNTDVTRIAYPLVSLLVSCYNVERFLPDFFKNIEGQTFKDFELIIVDDGSTDDTLKIIREYASTNNEIKVISHEYNKGLGVGRNTGLDAAKGKYVYFCDVDDVIKPNLLEYCCPIMENDSNIDFMIFSFDVEYPDLNMPRETILFKEMRLKSNKEIRDIYVKNLLLSRHGNGFVWNKFYRKSFLETNHIRFGSQKIQQDEVFNIHVLQAAASIFISSESLYKYNIFSSGNNGSRYINDRFEIFVEVRDSFERLLRQWGINSNLTEDYLNRRFYGNVMKCLRYDLCHKNCDLSRVQKVQRFKDITSHPYSIETRRYLMKNCSSFPFFEKFLLRFWNNYTLFFMTDSIYNTIYKAYKILKKS